MSYTADPRVDAYIDSLHDWQQVICREVRDLVHAADPEVVETIKRTNRPYFVLQGNICALLAAKDHVNVFLYDGAIVPDSDGIITAGHDNKTARTVAYRKDEKINAAALTAMLKQIIANNRAGGWRKLKHSPLTPREADVLELAADGLPVEEIARRASLSPGTVRNYLSAAAAKLAAGNRHEAVRVARSRGWI